MKLSVSKNKLFYCVMVLCVSVMCTSCSHSLSHATRGDLAERIPLSSYIVGTNKEPLSGDVLVVNEEGLIEKSFFASSPYVVGIVSTKPAHVLRGMIKESVPVALSGVVPCNVVAENGFIKPGDLIVSSSKEGYGMKATPDVRPGAVVAKALERQMEDEDVILVLVMLR